MGKLFKTIINKKEILIYGDDTYTYTAVVIVEHLDFFDTFEVNKFVRITGMKRHYQHEVEYVIKVESDTSAKLVEKELRIIDFQNKIITNDKYALELIEKGKELIEKPFYKEPYYEQ